MAEERLFRFMALRAAKAGIDRVPPGAIELQVNQGGDNSTHGEITRARAAGEIATDAASMPLNLKPFLRFLLAQAGQPPTIAKLTDGIRQAFNLTPAQLVAKPEFAATQRAVGDAIVAQTVVPAAGSRPDQLMLSARALALVQSVAAGTAPTAATIGDYLARTLVVLPQQSSAALARSAQAPSPEPDDEPQAPAADPAERRGPLERALGELEALGRRARTTSVDVPVPAPAEMAALRVDLDRMREALDEAVSHRPEEQTDDPGYPASDPVATGPATMVRASLRAAPEDLARLSDDTVAVLDELGLSAADLDPDHAVLSVAGALAQVPGPSLAGPSVVRLGGVDLDATVLKNIFGAGKGDLDGGKLLQACQAAASVGDLLIVKQKLKSYEAGDIAHVENVLSGESRSREHRRLDRTEETTTTEQETETEKERDLQSTERDELQTEATKTVETQTQLDAGLQVSGSYGPAVSFSSNLDVGYSTSTTESQRKATAFSREVTEKSAERVRERIRTERVRTVVEEVEEINKHGIENTGPASKHVRGVYRWLNKIYSAQTYNYGQRMMFDYVVPEPAAFWLYAQLNPQPKDGQLPMPQPPMLAGKLLQPDQISETNYLELVAQYQVTNAPVPPPLAQWVTYFDRQDGTTKNNMGRAAKIEIPAGYFAKTITVHTAYLWIEGDNNSFHLVLNGLSFDRTNLWGGIAINLLSEPEKEISIAYTILQSVAFAVSADVLCMITRQGWRKWQQQVYDAVIEAYQRQKAAYDEQQRVAAIAEANPVQGQNPLENVRLMRDELKKWVLMLMTGRTDIARDGFTGAPVPTLDLGDACANGSYIRFFENAFEWHNLLWVFYPYFWGREPRWAPALHFKDPDPDFAAFLKAGAARVQLPVRPGFERAVAYFMQHGLIWEGQDPPLSGDNAYLPIADEITENLGKIEGGVVYPAGAQPWEVTIPTSLVLLQNLSEVPAIRDMLTGQPITVTPTPGG
ncbi:hypothetical protein OHA70_32860 [Kribbella sp. NBC_00382]|uniref:hypothetical protein n=1 Tax=Kribbella sp. NBC_00382 TaxID=2975967 RepID=UPI002E1AFD21